MECRIAGYLGITLAEVDAMPAEHFDKLCRYYRVEPFGFPREDARHGEHVAAVYAASNRAFSGRMRSPDHWKYKVREPVKPEQVMAALTSAIPKSMRKPRGAR